LAGGKRRKSTPQTNRKRRALFFEVANEENNRMTDLPTSPNREPMNPHQTCPEILSRLREAKQNAAG